MALSALHEQRYLPSLWALPQTWSARPTPGMAVLDMSPLVTGGRFGAETPTDTARSGPCLSRAQSYRAPRTPRTPIGQPSYNRLQRRRHPAGGAGPGAVDGTGRPWPPTRRAGPGAWGRLNRPSFALPVDRAAGEVLFSLLNTAQVKLGGETPDW